MFYGKVHLLESNLGLMLTVPVTLATSNDLSNDASQKFSNKS